MSKILKSICMLVLAGVLAFAPATFAYAEEQSGTTATEEQTNIEQQIPSEEKGSEQATEEQESTKDEDTTKEQVKVKPHWEKKGDDTYYVKSDGTYAVGSYKVGNTYYVFAESGKKKKAKKERIVKINGTIYGIKTKGIMLTGWYVIDNKLYYFKKNGTGAKVSQTWKGFDFAADGHVRHKSNTSVIAKKEAVKLYRKITNDKMSKSKKLRVCYNYMTNNSNFDYVSKYPNLNKKHWQQKTAANMLSTRTGNCYSFACAFAALACECGYNAKVVCGRVSGSRDGARDGLTRHCWVQIDGLYYDPEGKYAHWYSNCYASSGYRVRHTIQKVIPYND